ncbi:MAG: acyl-CoA dehydrogenase family protein [Sulfuricaulis sp.]|nr:acyl-CoA dehydrogenase family protein [Sulfuricaulis sp.]
MKYQGIQHPLADCWMRPLAAETMMFKAAVLHDVGKPCGLEANSTKYLAGDAFFESATRAVRTHGGFGCAKAFHVERYFREAIIGLIAPVSQQLMLCHIAEKALGLPKSY